MHPKRALPRLVAGLLCVVMILTLFAAVAPSAQAQGNPPLWYRFRVGSVDPDHNTSYVAVTMRDQANCQGGFQVYTAENWNYWGMPALGDPMGRASDIGYEMHMWSGEVVPGAYYVRLGSGARPGCVVGVAGKAVYDVAVIDRGWTARQPRIAAVSEQVSVAASNPAPIRAPNRAMASNPAPAAPAVVSAHMEMAHHGREMATNEWMHVTDNEPMMYKFTVGHAPDEQTSHVSVSLISAPFRTGHFQVFTAENTPFYRPGQDDWFGQAESIDGRFATWYGDLPPGAYYVLVYPEGMKDCMLAVSGPAVGF